MTLVRRRARLASAAAIVVLAASPGTRASPQWNSAISAGVAGTSDGPGFWNDTRFFGALGGDVLFLRDGPRSFGLGPSLEVATSGFSDFRPSIGVQTIFPLGDLWGFGFRPAAYVRASDGGADPGLSARAWFGIQTYNYHGAYAPRGGLTLGYDHDVGRSDAHAFVILAEIDGLALALPFLLLYESFRGHSGDR